MKTGQLQVRAEAAALEATERALREVVGMMPGDGFGHFKLGEFLAGQGRAEEAEGAFRTAVELQPEFGEGLRGLAGVLVGRREFGEAIELLRRAAAARPDDAAALCDLGNALVNVKGGREAIVYLRQALRLRPGEQQLLSNLGLAFTEAGMFVEAEEVFLEALAGKPMFVPGHNNLANLYIVMGRLEEAMACLELAESLDRNNLITKCNRAIALLAMGDYEAGWREYQRRWDRKETPHRVYDQPLWRGEDLRGKRILLYTEEGLGDRIQFIRYAALLEGMGATVVCECPMPLMEVLRGARGMGELVEMGKELPGFDFHAPLLALPHLLRKGMLGAEEAYLTADAGRVARWGERLKGLRREGRLLVGVAWQGNPHHQWDRFRSMPLMETEGLVRMEGVRLVSLQRGPGVEQMEAFGRLAGGKLEVVQEGGQSTPGDLADTAAIMMGLDLVVSVDTATAHLAGALGRRVWVLLSTVTDWRWMRERVDTPWYPTMRLFRQKQLGDWGEVMGRVERAVFGLVRET